MCSAPTSSTSRCGRFIRWEVRAFFLCVVSFPFLAFASNILPAHPNPSHLLLSLHISLSYRLFHFFSRLFISSAITDLLRFRVSTLSLYARLPPPPLPHASAFIPSFSAPAYRPPSPSPSPPPRYCFPSARCPFDPTAAHDIEEDATDDRVPDAGLRYGLPSSRRYIKTGFLGPVYSQRPSPTLPSMLTLARKTAAVASASDSTNFGWDSHSGLAITESSRRLPHEVLGRHGNQA
jgi:hypothetical protein